MPPSLNKEGTSSIVPIRCPDALKSLLTAWLEPGETLSDLTRKLWAEEVTRRAMERDPNPPKPQRRRKNDVVFDLCPRCNLPCGGGCR
jgi:hypothetical protein